MKPIALLTGEDGFDKEIKGEHFVINKNYAACLGEAGFVPCLAYDVRNAEDYAEFADVLVLTGGTDLHPAWYGGICQNSEQMEEVSQSRDDLDFTLCRKFLEKKKPILAIGRGMQVVNVALGGTLCQCVSERTAQNHNLSGNYIDGMHRVWANHRNLLSDVCGECFFVNSYHKQAVACLGEGLSAIFQAEDKTIEAFLHKKRFILGMQWHPERKDWNGKAQVVVFKAFKKWIGKQEKELDKHKPIIMINGGPAFDYQFCESAWVANKTYSRAVSAAGGVPFMPLLEHEAEEYASFADSLIMAGSISFTPKKEQKKQLIKEELPKKECFDKQLFWNFYRLKKPILGICLGHQMINCYLGGTLESHFKFRTGVEHMLHQHQVTVEKNSVLFSLFGETFWVNSRHNDKIDRLADELFATAWSEDGVVEAFEHKRFPVYGVEWHPERMRGDFREPPEGPDMTKLFAWFCALKMEK